MPLIGLPQGIAERAGVSGWDG